MSAQITVTKTGLTKGYFDAIKSFREFLKDSGVLDFENLEIDKKYLVPVKLLPSGLEIELSMYRPKTKNGAFKRVCLSKELSSGLELFADDTIEFKMQGTKLCIRKLDSDIVSDRNVDTDHQHESNTIAVDMVPHRQLLPEGFFGWAASSKGGVRKPFDEGSGRPIRNQIETPVIKRLKVLATKLAEQDTKCSVVLLVGGPGNGKTDSIETFIYAIDSELKLNGSLNNLFNEKFREEAVRSVTVNVPRVGGNTSVKLNTITLIQDASQGDESSSRSHELLLKELNSHFNSNKKDNLLICCINRGILDQARHKARLENNYSQVLDVLEKLTKSITPSVDLESSWPLDCSIEGFYAWPMDVDSLIEKTSGSQESVLDKILNYAVLSDNWVSGYDDAEICPFASNKKFLSDQRHRQGLLRLLHQYQVASGKRWSFRELYGLVSFIMVGPENEFAKNNGFISPKEFSDGLFEGVESGDFTQEVQASYTAWSKLYYHQLFPDLPDFSPINEHCKKVFQSNSNYATKLLEVLCVERKDSGRVIDRTLDKEFRSLLDPALADAKEWEIKEIEGVRNMLDIERRFSVSIKEGLALIEDLLNPIEVRFFNILIKAEDDLDPSKGIDKARAFYANEATRAIRKLSSIIFKRSYGVKVGVGKDSHLIDRFIGVINDRRKLREIRAQLEDLLSNRKIPLMQIIGEPSAHIGSFPSFKCRPRDLSENQIPVGDSLPKWDIAFIEVDDDPEQLRIPLNFSLFKAIKLLKSGVHPACLPSELMSGITNLLSIIGGKLVRDNRFIDDPKSKIYFGGNFGELEVSGMKFKYSR